MRKENSPNEFFVVRNKILTCELRQLNGSMLSPILKLHQILSNYTDQHASFEVLKILSNISISQICIFGENPTLYNKGSTDCFILCPIVVL